MVRWRCVDLQARLFALLAVLLKGQQSEGRDGVIHIPQKLPEEGLGVLRVTHWPQVNFPHVTC